MILQRFASIFGYHREELLTRMIQREVSSCQCQGTFEESGNCRRHASAGQAECSRVGWALRVLRGHGIERAALLNCVRLLQGFENLWRHEAIAHAVPLHIRAVVHRLARGFPRVYLPHRENWQVPIAMSPLEFVCLVLDEVQNGLAVSSDRILRIWSDMNEVRHCGCL